jgi:hypothetical protein
MTKLSQVPSCGNATLDPIANETLDQAASYLG